MFATINGSRLMVPAIKLPDGSLSIAQQVDLTEFQGRAVRVYVSADGVVEVNPPGSYWHIAEVHLPHAVMDEDAAVPLDLSQHNVLFLDLPQE